MISSCYAQDADRDIRAARLGQEQPGDASVRRLIPAVVSVDPIAAAMWAGGIPREMTGAAAFLVMRAIAAEQLTLGLSVVVDAVNPTEAYRAM